VNSTAAVAQPQQLGLKPSRFGLRNILVLMALLAVTFGAVFTTAEKSQPFGDTLATVVESVSPFEVQSANAHTTMWDGIVLDLLWPTAKWTRGEGYLWTYHPWSGSPEYYQISSWHYDNRNPDVMYYLAAKARLWTTTNGIFSTSWDIATDPDDESYIIFELNTTYNTLSRAESWWQGWRQNGSYWDPVQSYCFKPPYGPYYSYFGFC
jgi:hypothetical protein